MAKKKLLGHAAFWMIITVGVAPLFYISAVKLGIAEAAQSEPAADQSGPADRFIENMAFGVGEKFSFEVKYGFISAGTASMKVVRLIEWQGRPCYQVVTEARSNSFFSSFYRVEDRVESIIDAAGLFAWRFEKKLREGSYRSDRQYDFDQVNNRVIYKSDTISVAPFVQDALSTLYYVRAQPLEVGKPLYVDNFIDGKHFHLEVQVLERESITVEAGTFDCFVVEPITQSVGLFKHEGRLKVWLTADRLRMPVLMKSKVIIGSIAVELTDYELGNPGEF
ncbi:MAG: DUF3108 domain-containing protein [Candidatus Zixiibacteriota bacterium]